ncbi:MAG: protein kinase [Polyangiaceae bacterium]|nr:protein kinase [Polyangiaceae bacterium]
MSDSAPLDIDASGATGWPEGAPARGEVVGGKYVCERLIGTGGMGAVLAGRHTQLGQRVAIKVLLPGALRDPLAKKRFLREARAAIVLRSEHVARVLDFGTLKSGAPYLVMEYLEGRDLKDMLARYGPLPVDAAIDYLMQASEALCEAHRRGIVHRDLKPANIFLSTSVDGTPLVKVLDFGISKTVAATAASSGSVSGITKTDAILGTPAYMSPEQLRSSKLVDHRTDVWSLGVTLYELLTDRLPFGSSDDGVASMCVHILEDPPPVLHKLRPDIPAALDEVLRRCVEKDPADRWPCVADMAAALARFGSPASADGAARIMRMSMDSLPFDPTVASDPFRRASGAPPATASAWGRTGAAARRKQLATLLVVASGAALLGLAVGGGWWMGNRGVAAETQARDADVLPTPGEPQVTASASEVTQGSTAPGGAAMSAAVSASTPLAVRSAPPAPTVARPVPAPHRASVEPSAKPQPPASATPAVPICVPGQVVSNGHCCVGGFEWKGGACVPGVAKGI